MPSVKGYYSIVQYCPDPSRQEGVNVGVVLFCPELRWLDVRFGNWRVEIERVFGPRDWDFLELERSAIEAHLRMMAASITRIEELERFVTSRANAFTLTDPRYVKVQNPGEELDALFRRLVERVVPVKQLFSSHG